MPHDYALQMQQDMKAVWMEYGT